MKITLFNSRFLNSPALSAVLVLVAISLAGTFHAISAQGNAPRLGTFDWSRHTNTLLVVEPTTSSCNSCQFSINGWVSRGIEAGLDVLVISHKKGAHLSALQPLSSSNPSQLSVLTDISPEIIHRFAPNDKISGVHIQNGHIVAVQHGGVPTVEFLG